MTSRALVLGGGGLAGIAWETGVLAGLADAGQDVTTADFLLGTSAGSTVGAQLGSGLPLAELFRRQVDPAKQNEEITPDPALVAERETWTSAMAEMSDPVELAKRSGALALAARTVPEPRRRAVIAARLPVHDWPERELAVVAIDAYTGQMRVFEWTSGIPLVDAVAASCAVPGIWPPVSIAGSRYIDGAARSGDNADLAAGYERVLIVSPMADPQTHQQVAELPTDRVTVITPDEASTAAFGPDPLNPSKRTPAALAGRRQGRSAASTVADVW